MIEASKPHDLRRVVESRLPAVRRQLASHGGGVDLVGILEDGVVQLRFTGMCAACMLKPLTMASVIHPALADVKGFTGLSAPGTRLSPHAISRLSVVRRDLQPTTGGAK
jgi:Fe-S cluster biogenesis protein NfuA